MAARMSFSPPQSLEHLLRMIHQHHRKNARKKGLGILQLGFECNITLWYNTGIIQVK